MAGGESSPSKGVNGDDLVKYGEGNDFGRRRRGQKALEVDEAGVGCLGGTDSQRREKMHCRALDGSFRPMWG
jgi:hypothetical protein